MTEDQAKDKVDAQTDDGAFRKERTTGFLRKLVGKVLK